MKKADKPHVHECAPETRGRLIHWSFFYDPIVRLFLLGRERAMRRMTLELAQIEPGDKVLDVGCGTGSLTISAKEASGPVGEVHGIDGAPEMIHVARQKAARAGVDIGFHVGLIEDIPFPDDRFDVVLSSLMMHHLPGDLKKQGIAEVHRVLRSNGRFLVLDLEPPKTLLIRFLIAHPHMEGNVRELHSLMDDVGFGEIEAGMTRYRILSFIKGKARKVKCGQE
ncbi:MAG: methyltransferase domain-containing protein [Proteobacteria bacterium]|nr:methyltransferase domain-containing protein [Pseudomonadota bacterium]